MARPTRRTVDFFSHDVHHTRTMAIIEDQFKNDGYAAWYKLLELLGDTEGHCFDCRNSINMQFLATRMHVSPDFRDGFMSLLAELEAIDKALWLDHRVIWCQHFVDRLTEVYRKRRQELPLKPCFRADNPITPVVSASETPQRRVEESRGEESIEEKIPMPTSDPPSEPPHSNRHFSATAGSFLQQIEKAGKAIQRLKLKKPLNVWAIIQTWTNQGKHPQLIIDVLEGAARHIQEKDEPYGYLLACMTGKEPQWRARTAEAEHEKDKTEYALAWAELVKRTGLHVSMEEIEKPPDEQKRVEALRRQARMGWR